MIHLSTASRPASPTRFGQRPQPDQQRPPVVAQIDTFQKTPANLYDVDGDRVGDLSHGTLVQRFLKAACPGVSIVPFPLASSDEHEARDVAEQLSRVLGQVERGVKFDAVVLPVGNHMTYDTFGAEPPLTGDNLKPYRAAIQQALTDCEDTKNLGKALESIDLLVRKGVPVYVSAGNGGSSVFNALNLGKGSTNVGAQYADSTPTWYTANNSLINRKAQGTFAVTKVGKDFDMTGDGKADVLSSEVSGGQPVIRRFVGKAPKAVLATKTDILVLQQALANGRQLNDIPVCQNKLFSIRDLQISIWQSHAEGSKSWLEQGGGLSVETLEALKTLGDFVLLQDEDLKVFKSEAGKLVYNPDNSGRANPVNQIAGTSFAAPYLLGKELTAKV